MSSRPWTWPGGPRRITQAMLDRGAVISAGLEAKAKAGLERIAAILEEEPDGADGGGTSAVPVTTG